MPFIYMISIRSFTRFSLYYFVFLVCSSTCFSADQELLVNGDFETGPYNGHFQNGYPYGWQGWNGNGWHHSDHGYMQGSYGIAIGGNDTACYQAIGAAEGDCFLVSGEMIFHASEVLVNKNGYINIEFWDGPDSAANKLSSFEIGVITPAQTSAQWYSYRESAIAPVGTTEVRIVCSTAATSSSSTGKVFWDNISVINTGKINTPDYNGDLVVDLKDLNKLAEVWNQESSDCNLSDSNYIDLADLHELAANWLKEIPPYPGYQLVWADEFDSATLNMDNWSYDTGNGNNGWGNSEWQYYTSRSKNLRIINGQLVIQAYRESYGGQDYTSARIHTNGKQSFKYGRIEARIKPPAGGHGIWPAFWMLGANIGSVGWPACGEIDILEMMSDNTKCLGTLHYGSGDPLVHESNGGEDSSLEDYTQEYHIFAVEWDQNSISWYRDNVLFYRSSSWWSSTGDYPAPFDRPFYIILNFAVGSAWWDRSITDSEVEFPQHMLVDYVRVYSKIE